MLLSKADHAEVADVLKRTITPSTEMESNRLNCEVCHSHLLLLLLSSPRWFTSDHVHWCVSQIVPISTESRFEPNNHSRRMN